MDDNVLKIFFKKGNTHFQAATIELFNCLNNDITEVIIVRNDLGSWDNYAESGSFNKEIGTIKSGNKAQIDSLSSFDLEFENHYQITYLRNGIKERLKFSLYKHGNFEIAENLKGLEGETHIKYLMESL